MPVIRLNDAADRNINDRIVGRNGEAVIGDRRAEIAWFSSPTSSLVCVGMIRLVSGCAWRSRSHCLTNPSRTAAWIDASWTCPARL